MRRVAILAALLFATSAGAGESFEATKAKAEQGDAEAQIDLGRVYREGLDVAKDEAEAEAASDGAPEAKERGSVVDHPLYAPVLFEGLAIAFSGFAAWSPKTTGWFLVGVSPLTLMGGDAEDNLARAASLGFMAGLGLFNALELSEDHYSTGEVFLYNMVIWNGLVGVAFLADWLASGEQKTDLAVTENDGWLIGAAPIRGGAFLGLMKRF